MNQSRTYYTLDVPFIIGRRIREYDIQKANISILYTKGIIDKQTYDRLFVADRMTRQMEIGIMRKNENVEKALKEGISYYIQRLLNDNGILPQNVLSVKNDAVFILDQVPTITEFDGVKFINKNMYTSFFKLLNYEVYYFSDALNMTERTDVKGIKDEVLEKHKGHFLELLNTIFFDLEHNNIIETVDLIRDIYNNYIDGLYDIECYREFDHLSNFRISIDSMYTYTLANAEEGNQQYLDMSLNLSILRQLMSYASMILFGKA